MSEEEMPDSQSQDMAKMIMTWLAEAEEKREEEQNGMLVKEKL